MDNSEFIELDCGWLVRLQGVLDSCRDIGMVVNEPKPDE